jgi:hypothetical protein
MADSPETIWHGVMGLNASGVKSCSIAAQPMLLNPAESVSQSYGRREFLQCRP